MIGPGLTQHLAHDYGGKKAALRHFWSLVQHRLGSFRSYERVSWGEVERVVFVCAGNICRSAYADGYARTLGLRAASFGLSAREGDAANPEAARAAASRGVSLDGHRAQAAAAFKLLPGDLLLAMEPAQGEALAAALLPAGVQLTLLGLWASPARPLIEDPYGLCGEYFATCFGVIEGALRRLAPRLTGAHAGAR